MTFTAVASPNIPKVVTNIKIPYKCLFKIVLRFAFILAGVLSFRKHFSSMAFMKSILHYYAQFSWVRNLFNWRTIQYTMPTYRTVAAFCTHLSAIATLNAAVPSDYRGTYFTDAVHKAGPPNIPGIVQCALYDLGGEGVAYHDSDAVNNGSGKLNLESGHQRIHANKYIWHFRQDEGVDLSFVKDWADLNHTNLVSPHINQLYIGWTENDEWCNYTVNVIRPGTYRIKCLYAYQPNTVKFDLNGKPATECHLPVATSSYHHWNLAQIGIIKFHQTGQQVLTFHYGKGNNFAYFEFELIDPLPPKSNGKQQGTPNGNS